VNEKKMKKAKPERKMFPNSFQTRKVGIGKEKIFNGLGR